MARQPFASTHPAIDALFQREFAQNQEAEKGDIARRQIDASAALANAQLQHAYAQQDYANLFREREFQSREEAEKVRQEQADRYLKLYEGATPDKEAQRIQQINAAAKAAAARFQAAYDAEVGPRLVQGRQNEKDATWFKGMRPDKVNEIDANWDNPAYAPRAKIEADAWQRAMNKMAKDPELQIVIPDPNRRIFLPIQLDPKGNLIPFDRGTNVPPPAPGATNNPAALGPVNPPTAATATNEPGFFSGLIGGTSTPFYRILHPNAATAAPATPSVTVTNPANAQTLNPPAVPGVPSVRHAFGADHDVLLLPEDSAILIRELPHVDETNRPTAYAVMIDQFLKAGRARIVPRVGGGYTPLVPATEPNLPNRPPF